MIGFPQVPPKDNGALNAFAADPLGRAPKEPAQKPPYQQTSDGDLPGAEESANFDAT